MGGDRSFTLGLIGLVFGAVALGFAAPLVKLSELGPQATSFWRLLISLPALALILALDRNPQPGKPDYRLIVLAGFLFAGDLAVWHAGITLTTVANATLLANLAPVVVVIGAFFLFGERFGKGFLIAAALALTGAVLISAANIEIDPARLPGDALSAFTALWYGAYMLAVRAARKTASSALFMFVSTIVSAIGAGLVAVFMGEDIWPQTLAAWGPLLLLGLGVHIAGQGGLAFGLGRVPAGLASIIILIQPMVAALAGWLIFDEAMVPIQIFGAALVLAGAWLARRSAQTDARPSAALGQTPEQG